MGSLIGRIFGGGRAMADPETMLRAASTGNWELVQKLLVGNPELAKARRYDGWTPLHFAVNYGDKNAADLLIGRGADVNAPTDEGWTPLHMAATAGEKAIAELLISGGANINARTKSDTRAAWIPRGFVQAGATPLKLAVMFNCAEVAHMLRRYGAKE